MNVQLGGEVAQSADVDFIRPKGLLQGLGAKGDFFHQYFLVGGAQLMDFGDIFTLRDQNHPGVGPVFHAPELAEGELD